VGADALFDLIWSNDTLNEKNGTIIWSGNLADLYWVSQRMVMDLNITNAQGGAVGFSTAKGRKQPLRLEPHRGF
jgi:hypothetical protein